MTGALAEPDGRRDTSGAVVGRINLQTACRWLAALFSLGAAGFHFAVTPEHFNEYWLFGWFFVTVAWLQALYALLVVVVPGRRILAAGLFGNLLLVGIWLWTRVVAVPLGPEAVSTEALGLLDAMTVGFEWVVVALSAALWRTTDQMTSRRLPSLTLAVACLGVFVLLGVVLAANGSGGSGHEDGASGHGERRARG